MLGAAIETRPPADKPSAYLLNKPRILREVCQTMRQDDGGRRCAQCCVRDFCEKQAQIAGRRPAISAARR